MALKRSIKEIILDPDLNYTNVLDFLDIRMRDYINSNNRNLDFLKRYLIAHVVNNTYDIESQTFGPKNGEEIIGDFKSITHENFSKILGLPSNDPEIDIYLEAKEEILRHPSPIPTLLGRLKNSLGFIGCRYINKKEAYSLKIKRVDDFEKRFGNEPQYKNLKNVILNLLERSSKSVN